MKILNAKVQYFSQIIKVKKKCYFCDVIFNAKRMRTISLKVPEMLDLDTVQLYMILAGSLYEQEKLLFHVKSLLLHFIYV